MTTKLSESAGPTVHDPESRAGRVGGVGRRGPGLQMGRKGQSSWEETCGQRLGSRGLGTGQAHQARGRLLGRGQEGGRGRGALTVSVSASGERRLG